MQFYKITGKNFTSSMSLPQLLDIAKEQNISVDPWAVKRHLLVGTRDIHILLDPLNHTYDLKRERLSTAKYGARSGIRTQEKLSKTRNYYDPDWKLICKNT